MSCIIVSSDLKSELIREVTQEFERRISEGDDKAAHLDVTPIEAGLSETAGKTTFPCRINSMHAQSNYDVNYNVTDFILAISIPLQ